LNAPSASGRQYPLLIYNHSLISFASENTLLMEWLASRGYVVVSLRHREQAEEYAAIQKGISEDEQARDRELTSRLRKTLTRKERAELSLMQFENSSGVSMIVKRRAEDSAFVLANLSQVLTRIPGASDDSIAPDFGALGLSLGGAVATRFCLAEPRCAGVANLDGGLYGLDKSRLLRSPYLMIYSQDNAGTNDAFVQGTEGYQELVLQGAKHLDLQDASVVLPILKWFGMLGAGSGKAKNHRMKAAVASFFDRALKPPISG